MSDEMDLGVLAESFAEMLSAEWPREKALAHAKVGGGHDAALWEGMAALGWQALTVEEAHGGLGLGMDAVVCLHLALGAAVAPVPMLGTTIASALVQAGGSENQKSDLLPALAEGRIKPAVAAAGTPPVAANDTAASGEVRDLLDADGATHLFIPAVSGGSQGWLVIDTAKDGVSIDTSPLVDTSRTLANVRLLDLAIGPDDFIATSQAAEDAVRRAAMLAIAADSQGGAEAVLAATVDYMKVREQFGVLIGSFQALKHRVADHQTALVASRHLLEFAAGLGASDPLALLYAASAKQHATRTAAEIARDCIQLHGGVGFTAEFVPHLYLKRAKVNEALWGIRAATLDRIADMLEAA